MRQMKCKLYLTGILKSPSFVQAQYILQDLYDLHDELFEQPEVEALFEQQWLDKLKVRQRKEKPCLWGFNSDCLVYCDDKIIGDENDLQKWALDHHKYNDIRVESLYQTLALHNYVDYLKNSKRKHIKMGITIGSELVGDLILELFYDITPKTCQNFYAFCMGSAETIEKNEVEKYKNSYQESIFFRCITDGFIQGGDLLYGSGNEGVSIYGQLMADENFILSHDQRGLLTTVNNGRHSNNSQFMITLGPTKWMDFKQVCFGRVVEGYHTLNAMEKTQTVNQRPIKEIKIASIVEITPEYLNLITC